jgi:hypothetical protein
MNKLQGDGLLWHFIPLKFLGGFVTTRIEIEELRSQEIAKLKTLLEEASAHKSPEEFIYDRLEIGYKEGHGRYVSIHVFESGSDSAVVRAEGKDT